MVHPVPIHTGLFISVYLNHIFIQKSLYCNVYNLKNQIQTATNWSHRKIHKKIWPRFNKSKIFSRYVSYSYIFHKHEFSLTVTSLGYIQQYTVSIWHTYQRQPLIHLDVEHSNRDLNPRKSNVTRWIHITFVVTLYRP